MLSQFEDLSAHTEEKEMILVFNHNIGEAITSAAEINCDDDGYILAKAANILRMYVGHNNYWINFRVDGFSLELIFAWICFHELLILGIVRGFILRMADIFCAMF